MVTPVHSVALCLTLLAACRMEPGPGWSAAGSSETPGTTPSADPDEPSASGGAGGSAARGGSGGRSATGGSSSARGGGGASPDGSVASGGSMPDDTPSG